MTDAWRKRLKQARTKLGLSRRALAERVGISGETVRGYEQARRKPSRARLVAVLDALQFDRGWRNEILLDAGFAPDGLAQRPSNIGAWMFTEDEASSEIATYEWPAFVLTERAQVVAANPLVQRLWGVDMELEYPDPLERNLLAVASDPRFADRCLNWDEVIALLIGTFKTYHRQPESIEEPTPYFAAALSRFLAGDPKYVARFAELWEAAPESVAVKIRWTYAVVWKIEGVGVMHFRGTASAANESDGLTFHDWIPLDAPTWHALSML